MSGRREGKKLEGDVRKRVKEDQETGLTGATPSTTMF